MSRTLASLIVAAAVLTAQAHAASTIKQLDLSEAYDDDNRIASPVYDPQSSPSVRFEGISANYELRKDLIVRRVGGSFFNKGPEYKLEKGIDLAAILSSALGPEASAMGLKVTDTQAEWRVRGSLDDIYLESRQVYMGATLFYGYMNLSLTVEQGQEAPQQVKWRFHKYCGAYSGGMGRKDEAKEGLGRLLLEGSQEIVARLNRIFFKAAPSPGLASPGDLAGASRNDIHRLGLSGSPDATRAILQALPGVDEENERAALIEALGRLGNPEAVELLSARYASEDEDCRWSTLKAMDYIGGEAAISLVRTRGRNDDDDHIERLAKRILGEG